MTYSTLYWEDRWNKNDIKWHEPEVHPFLVKFLPSMNLLSNDVIFVPFCGASVDMIYMMNKGYRVVGSELSSVACETFYKDNDLDFEIENIDSFTLYKNDKVQIYCGDYFSLKQDHFRNIHTVYDRAALIALPEYMRAEYVKQMYYLLPNKLNILLITMTCENMRTMPPYSVDINEVKLLYGESNVEVIAESHITPVCDHLRERDFKFPNEYAVKITNN